jgi:hypothetical protein
MTLPVKDPDSILDYPINWTSWLEGDTAATSAWTVPAGLTEVGSDTLVANVAVIWLSGGTAGVSYDVQSRITTTGGRTQDHTITIVCAER